MQPDYAAILDWQDREAGAYDLVREVNNALLNGHLRGQGSGDLWRRTNAWLCQNMHRTAIQPPQDRRWAAGVMELQVKLAQTSFLAS